MKFSFNNGIPANLISDLIFSKESRSITIDREVLQLKSYHFFLLQEKTSRVILSYIYKCSIVREVIGFSNIIITHLINFSKSLKLCK